LGYAGTWDERSGDIEKNDNIASAATSESVTRGRQIVEEQGLKLLDEDIE
jgi:hypothetical protein